MPYTYKHGDRPLEGFCVQRAVGRGGFGEVYYALADSGKQVALKYLRENPEIELRGIAHVLNLKSPHLITIYDVKRNAAGDSFVIMEYVGGPSLRELLLAEPAGMSPQKVAFLLRGIVAGLSYLHERGIVHRDMKPANIFYDDGYVKIGDYGLSKHISVSRHSGQTVSVGTVHYMAPEIGSGSYTKAIDIYALGVIVYEMLTGRLPFTGASMGEVLMRHLKDNPDLSGVPAPFAAVIAKALAKDPSERYQDAEEMLAAILDSPEFSREVEAFDASALTQVPRAPEAHDPDQTLTSPARPAVPPPLDVREGPIPQVGQPDLPPRLRAKLDRLNQKLDEKFAKVEAKAARIQEKWGGWTGRGQPPSPADGPVLRLHRLPQLFVLLIVVVGVGIVLSILHPGGSRAEDQAAAIIFYIVGGIAGPLLAHLVLMRRWYSRSGLVDRLVYATVGGFCMLIGYGIASDAHLHSVEWLILAPIAAIGISDWRRLIENGRRGQVKGGVIIWPAIVGFVTTAIANEGDYMWVAAGVCATIALLTQATAALWPVMPALPTFERPAPFGRGMPLPRPGVGHVVPTPGPAAPPNAPTMPAGPPPEAAVVVDAAGPSFSRRGGHAGLSFLGKLLLLVGLVSAIGYGVPHRSTTRVEMSPGPGMRLGPMSHLVVSERVRIASRTTVLCLAAGSVLLVLARRGAGAGHMVRGVAGCGLLIAGALCATTVADAGVAVLINSGWTQFTREDPTVWGPVAVVAAMLFVGLVLLAQRRRDPNRPIVI